MKVNIKEAKRLKAEIDHIFESFENEIKVCNAVIRFVNSLDSWINPMEKMPPDAMDILIIHKRGWYFIASVHEDWGTFDTDGDQSFAPIDIWGWTHLPEPPKK